jgi:hypothetical protein
MRMRLRRRRRSTRWPRGSWKRSAGLQTRVHRPCRIAADENGHSCVCLHRPAATGLFSTYAIVVLKCLSDLMNRSKYSRAHKRPVCALILLISEPHGQLRYPASARRQQSAWSCPIAPLSGEGVSASCLQAGTRCAAQARPPPQLRTRAHRSPDARSAVRSP